MKIVKTENTTGFNGHPNAPPSYSDTEVSEKKSAISQFFGKIFSDDSSGKSGAVSTADNKSDTPQKPEPKPKKATTTPTPPSQPTMHVCKFCNRVFVKRSWVWTESCGLYHNGRLKPKADVIAQLNGGHIAASYLDDIPDPLWSCCLKKKSGAGCVRYNGAHSAVKRAK